LLEYFENIRYDYEPDVGVLVLRLMPTRLHECIQDNIFIWITAQLFNLDPELAGLVENI
jgi:hypothetical protein